MEVTYSFFVFYLWCGGNNLSQENLHYINYYSENDRSRENLYFNAIIWDYRETNEL